MVYNDQWARVHVTPLVEGHPLVEKFWKCHMLHFKTLYVEFVVFISHLKATFSNLHAIYNARFFPRIFCLDHVYF